MILVKMMSVKIEKLNGFIQSLKATHRQNQYNIEAPLF